ncbi:hypothetical protein EAF00_011453 [Botryotinia globosa]|nr:hypothetical protein EAF00_011453 [Botryotinia globosa]
MTRDFDWNLPGLNKREFTAYANLLALRNNGQVEPVSLGMELSDKNESTTDSDVISIDTSYCDKISDSGYHQLKTKFLDCLAELTANKKGDKHVACSSMMEGEENVTLWITRNGGFQIVDNIVLEKLSKRLSGMFHEKYLLEDTYIPNLRLSLKSCNTVFNDANNDKFTRASNELSVLQNQTFSGLKAGQRLIGRHDTLVTKAYDLRRSKVVEELLQTSPKSTKQTRKLWVDVCFLSRLRVILEKFKGVSLKLPSFNNVTIIPVTGDRIPQKVLRDALKLRETLDLLDLPTDTLTVETVIGPSWTVAKAEREYGKLQNQADKVAKSVVQVQKDIEKELKSDFDKAVRLERTSVVGGSSIFSDRKAEKSGKSETAFPKPTWGNLSGPALTESNQLGECNTCSKVTWRLCRFCNKDFYCSELCETKTNGSHLFTCAKRPLTSAGYLYRNIVRDAVPDEADVLEDFGFNRLVSFADHSTFYDQAKAYLDEEDQHKQPSQLEPEAKMQCYELLATVLHAAHPNPIQKNWYSFGLALAMTSEKKARLGCSTDGCYSGINFSMTFEETINTFSMVARHKQPLLRNSGMCTSLNSNSYNGFYHYTPPDHKLQSGL